MNLFTFMFSSVYDQASLAIMAIGLLLNAVADFVKRPRGGA